MQKRCEDLVEVYERPHRGQVFLRRRAEQAPDMLKHGHMSSSHACEEISSKVYARALCEDAFASIARNDARSETAELLPNTARWVKPVCMGCGHENPCGSKFCNDCGHRPLASSEIEELRHVEELHHVETVLKKRGNENAHTNLLQW